jgi:two-component system, chemotaxis family, sensor kinase CheA
VDVGDGNPEKMEINDVIEKLNNIYTDSVSSESKKEVKIKEEKKSVLSEHEREEANIAMAEAEALKEISEEVEVITSTDNASPINSSNISSNIPEGMGEIYDSFIIESDEILDTLDQDLIKLEKNSNDDEIINKIFRGVHTIKGTSSFVEFDQMTYLTHHLEDVLNRLRHHELQLTATFMDVLLEAVDIIKELLNRFKKRNPEPYNLTDILASLKALDNNTGKAAAKVSEAKIVGREEKAKSKANSISFKDQTIRVDVSRLDSLMNLVGELVASRNRLTQLSSDLNINKEQNESFEDLLQTASQIDFVTSELQTAVMKTRMLPVGKVFNKFPRLIRDISREFGKKINLEIHGEDTELDKSVIEEIGDPMVHLIRNAADHGIEMPEDRRQAGKAETGTVKLIAQHEGNNIVIIIEDDGKGIAFKKVLDSAIKKGLVTEEESRIMTNKDISNLIFMPGFSTAEKITNISGRGVGMDVVKTNIAKLNGVIDIESFEGEGTRFIIKLPITLAIIQGLLASIKDEIYIIPLANVLETINIKRSDIQFVNNKEVVKNRDRILPLLRLSDIYHVPGDEIVTDKHYVIVVGVAENQIGLIVDKLLGQQEVVIKSLGLYLSSVRGVSGSAILGDGKVRMIVDISELVELAKRENLKKAEEVGELVI